MNAPVSAASPAVGSGTRYSDNDVAVSSGCIFRRNPATDSVARNLASFIGPARRATILSVGGPLRCRQLRPRERGSCADKTKGRGTKWMVIVDSQGIPLGGALASASPSEVKLIEATLDQVAVPHGGRGRPRKRIPRLFADKSYDSGPLRKRLKRQRGIDLICPHRRNRTKPRLQDGRKLRRYRRRFIIERTFAWLGAFMRLVVRWGRLITVFRAFFHLTCLMIVLRQL